MSSYQEFMKTVEKWYASATVKNSQRHYVPSDAKDEYVYPTSKVIISTHPLVKAKGDEVVKYAIAQMAYNYMYGIGLLETRFVIDCGLNIANNLIKGFSEADKLAALRIVIDEGYHAHVALDYILQMKEITGIEPLNVPETNGNLSAVNRAFEILPKDIHYDFQLISVTLAEHTLTKDMISIGRDKEMSKTFSSVLTDHVSDEGVHASYFARLMKEHWARLSEDTKDIISEMLPSYLDDYLAYDSHRDFERSVLKNCGLSEIEIAKVIEDTDPIFISKSEDYFATTKSNLINLLKRSGFFEHKKLKESFEKAESQKILKI
ncbi:diiron oxygenase [Acinetobacter sp. RW6]|uniref:diiron oxygenase n=1 Tax=Acinetobacter sp. RW6 TaxID=3242680 RepID=UPI0035C0EC15